ncbi:MAG: NADH-quinone oxidoreductase subunit C [Eggerthellaceae bacterium]|nr:NADH-quinone oxidoreductase subunit C [Eggerthellaceae bacterium]
MALDSEFIILPVTQLAETSKRLKAEGYRFVQMLAIRRPLGLDLVYSFMKDDRLENYRLVNVDFDVEVPSVTGEFLNAFVFENEAHDLFGAKITGIAIDFKGKFYGLTTETPMKFSNESRERLEKGGPLGQKEREARAAAAAAAKAKAEEEAKAKAAEEANKAEEEKKAQEGGKAEEKPAEKPAEPKAEEKQPAEPPKAEEKPADKPAEAPKKADDEDAAKKLEEKLKGMDPEKAAKVRAALEAKAKKAAAAAKEAGNE